MPPVAPRRLMARPMLASLFPTLAPMLKNAGVRDKESGEFNIKGIRYLTFYVVTPQGLDSEIIMKILIKGV